MKLKKIIAVFLIVGTVVCLSLSVGAFEASGARYFGLISASTEKNVWAKYTIPEGDSTQVTYGIAPGEYLRTGSFFTTDTSSFNMGYSYEMTFTVSCMNGTNGSVDSDTYGRLNDCYFSATSVLPSDFSSSYAVDLNEQSNEPLGANMQYSFDRSTGKITAIYHPYKNHNSMALRCIQWNSTEQKLYFAFKLNSVKIVRDVDGSYFDQQSAALLGKIDGKLDDMQVTINSGNEKLDGINDSINSGNEKLDGIKDSIDSGNKKLDGIQNSLDNAPNNEYDWIEDKKGESKEDEDEAQEALNNLLPIEDIKASFMDFFGAVSSNNVATSITLPAAHMPSFAGGVQLWKEQKIDFSPWLNNSYISTIITVVKILSSIWMLYICVSYVWNMLQEALGHDKMTDSGLLPSGGDDI